MKKLLIFLILAYLPLSINTRAANENDKTLKIGVLLPLSGKYQNLGESFLKLPD